MMFCSKCGSDLRGGKSSCPTCGYSLSRMKLEDSQRRIGYKHTEIRRDTPIGSLRRDENGDPILPYSDEWRKAREEDQKPRVLTFRKFDDEN